MRALLALFVVACGSPSGTVDAPGGGGDVMEHHDAPVVISGPRTVFVIPLENKAATQIYGNTIYAPYINGLLAHWASASKFQDELPALASEPHYVWMEAGTNAFTDTTFLTDNDPSSANSTSSTAHLTAQLDTAHVAWMSYQEDIAANTCPLATSGEYAPKHDPFIFFQDVIGSPPSPSSPKCVAHHKPYSAFATDLAAGVTGLVFITPNLCHDMHGDSGCPAGTSTNPDVQAGDTWLSNELPRIITYAQTHDALIFLTWDEGTSTNLMPFLAFGNHVVQGVSATTYSHSSMLKSIEEWLGVPVLQSVMTANDFRGMFAAGSFP